MPNSFIIQNKNIVVVGLQAWDEPLGSNCKDIALEFKKYNKVLYVNYPINRKSLWSKSPNDFLKKRFNVLKGKEPEISQIDKSFWVLNPKVIMEPSNWLKVPFLFDWLNKYNNYRFSLRIKAAMSMLKFENIILFNDQDIYRGFYLKEYLKPNRFIYYIRDYLLGVDFFKLNGSRLEPKLIKKADLVVCNSVFLQQYAKKYNNRSYYVGQGCDLTIFNPLITYNKPESMLEISGPIIGYVGALASHRLDISLLYALAEKNPKWNLVLVGPEDDVFINSILHQLKNVYFLGNQPIHLLPDFISFFNVCINPQLVNSITIGNYPRKVDEYLALGKPTVAVDTPTMQIFSEFVYLAKDQDCFLNEVKKALEESSDLLKKGRIQFASSHTWENSFYAISDAFSKLE